MRALHGIRVLDYGRYIAGPYAALLLAELGAEVIRVERPRGSEDRFLGPVAQGGEGAMFLQCNAGKQGLTLEPTSEAGREITRRLVRTADVVVANLPGEALATMGLDYESLVVDRPDVILASVTAFGSEGPYAGRVGFDGVGQAMSGAMYLSGTSDAPVKCVTNYVDFATALSAALGVVAALHERSRTGKGQVVEASLLGSALALMGGTLLEEAALEIGRVGTANRSQLSGPSDTFRTKDGFILVQTVGQPLFRRWAELMGEPQWLDDPRFTDDAARGVNGLALSDRMQAWCRERTAAAALEALSRAKIPAGPVHSPRQTLADPHVAAGGFLRPVEYPGAPGRTRGVRPPFGFPRDPAPGLGRAPTLGEHTQSLLEGLGFSQAEVTDLRARGVV